MTAVVLVIWKVTFILLVACVLNFALRWTRPQWRVLLWRGAWLGIVVTAVASVVLPAWEISLPGDQMSLTATEGKAAPVEMFANARESPVLSLNIPDSAVPVVEQSTPALSSRPRWNVLTVLPGLWALVVIFLGARWVRNYLALAGLRSRAKPTSRKLSMLADEIAGKMRFAPRPHVLVSREIDSPCSVSVRKPVILLPNAEDPDMQAILAHEIAHLRSRDLLWIWAMDWLVTVLWFHPLCWFMRCEHLFACEAASDAAAANTVRDSENYSAALARIALYVSGDKPAATVAVSMARSSQIIKRLRLLERRQPAACLSRWKLRLAFVSMFAVSLIIGSMQFGIADDEENTETDPIIGTWKDDKGGWHRFAANGWYIELRENVRTFESWARDSEKARQWKAGLSKVHLQDRDTLVIRREGVVKELNLTQATPPTEEIRNRLAIDSPNDEADRKRLQGIWVVKGGDIIAGGLRFGKCDTWIRFAPDGSFTKVHWSEEGCRSAYARFRLARFRGGWIMKNRLLTALGASIQWRNDRSFVAQLKSYDDSGLWKGAILYEKPSGSIPDEVQELLFAEPNEKNRQHLIGTWNRNAEGTSWITFEEDGSWSSQAGGNRNGGYWEVTGEHLVLHGFRIQKILRLNGKIYEYEEVPVDKKERNPVRVTLHKVAASSSKGVGIRFNPIKPAFGLTGPAKIVMILENAGEVPFRFREGGRRRGARDNQFSFAATLDGKPLTLIEGRDHGGKSRIVTIEPGESYEMIVDLRKWFSLDRPGRIHVQGRYETDAFHRGITQPEQQSPIRLSAEFEVTIIGDIGAAQLQPEETSVGAFRGIDLTEAPSTTKTNELHGIWEARPPGSVGFEIRKDFIVFPVGFDGVVYFRPDVDRYYIQSDPLGSSTMTFYGPFKGNPFEKLELADDLFREALQRNEPEAVQRACQLLDRFAKSENDGLRRMGKEILARVGQATKDKRKP